MAGGGGGGGIITNDWCITVADFLSFEYVDL